MRLNIQFLVFVSLLGIMSSYSAFSDTDGDKFLRTFVDDSNLIVEARVKKIRSYYKQSDGEERKTLGGKDQYILSDIDLDVIQTYLDERPKLDSNATPPQQLILQNVGGCVIDRCFDISLSHTIFRKGDRTILFLKGDGSSIVRSPLYDEGIFKINRNEIIERTGESFQSFEARIKKIVKNLRRRAHGLYRN